MPWYMVINIVNPYRVDDGEEVAYEYEHRMPPKRPPTGYEYTKRKWSPCMQLFWSFQP